MRLRNSIFVTQGASQGRPKGELTALPQTPSRNKGALLLRGREGKGGEGREKKGGERRGKGREREVEFPRLFNPTLTTDDWYRQRAILTRFAELSNCDSQSLTDERNKCLAESVICLGVSQTSTQSLTSTFGLNIIQRCGTLPTLYSR